WLAPGALRRAARLMDEHPQVVLTYGTTVIVRGATPVPEAIREQPNDWQILRGVDFVEQACRSTKNPVGTPSAIGRTAIQKRIGGYRKELPHTADLEMWLRFAANGAVGLINTCQAFYREHGQNMSVPYYRQGVRDIQ